MSRLSTILVLSIALAAPAAARPTLSGPLAGTLAAGQYDVTGDIWVAAADTLRILAPSDLAFTAGTSFEINGRLTATGAPGDSIRFAGASWEGLRFFEAAGHSRLAYCRISGATLSAIFCRNSALDLAHVELSANAGGMTGGLRAYQADLTLAGCRIVFNTNSSAISGSGGVHITDTDALIEDCAIENNTAPGTGTSGGLYASGGQVVIRRCTMSDNLGSGFGGGLALMNCAGPRVANCVIAGNENGSSGGVHVFGCTDARLDSCTIAGNQSHAGGGIRCEQSDLTLTRCLVTGNTCLSHWYSPGWGGGILAQDDARLALHYCTVADNVALPWLEFPPTGNGICVGYLAATEPNLELRGCILAGNRGEGGGGLYAQDASVVAQITYGDFWDNEGGDFAGTPLDPALGVICGVNANGDPCDAYANIFADPLFAIGPADDYHLAPASPCIDAGDPADPCDPDGTTADQGARSFDQTTAAPAPATAAPAPVLLPAWPNPFNPAVRIAFDLPRPARVRLTVHDAAGRLLRTLATGPRAAGRHEVVWDGRDAGGTPVASGVYLCRLEAGGQGAAGKLTLLK
ncbi:MAG: right-handed parallel beta-helix repeat-containing protein [Candidatus Krumholzibacteriota bacterium]|nr:right-handed parallel beta-helix repeat-containing protein [Candidatus Krumholzibacteriota bacterium]